MPGGFLMIVRLLFAAVPLVMIGGPSVHAVEPSERLADPALEARARTLSTELRCLVCQNQSIDESNADLAHDLRVLLRQRLVAGDTDQQERIVKAGKQRHTGEAEHGCQNASAEMVVDVVGVAVSSLNEPAAGAGNVSRR